MSLEGRRILITRPVGQADFLLHSLQDRGASAVHLPLLAIEPLNPLHDAEKIQHARTLVQQLDNFSKIIFISTNAVTHALPLMENFWVEWPLGVAWYGIGSATQLALQKHAIDVAGINDNAVNNAMTSESLLSLPAFADLQQQRILIVQGEGGRELLSPVMQQRGARVDALVCYRRTVPQTLADDWQAIATQPLDAVLISSGEGLQNWLALPEIDRYRQTLLVTPGERVAVQARAAGFQQVIVAENASDKAMFAALQAVV
jgi:uroporphyrinogen-III synthase